MKLQSGFILAVAFAVLAGCSRGPRSTVEGPKGEKLTVAVVDNIVLTQGEKKKFSVTVTREKLQGPVRLKFDLPDGLKIVEPESEWTVDSGTKQHFYTLEATVDAKPQKEARVRVTATHDAIRPAADEIRVELQESLAGKQARKEAFAKQMNQKLDDIQENLKTSGKLIMGELKDPSKKSTHLKRMGELYENLAQTRKQYDELVAAPVETWERKKTDVSSAVTSLARSVDQFHQEVKNDK